MTVVGGVCTLIHDISVTRLVLYNLARMRSYTQTFTDWFCKYIATTKMIFNTLRCECCDFHLLRYSIVLDNVYDAKLLGPCYLLLLRKEAG